MLSLASALTRRRKRKRPARRDWLTLLIWAECSVAAGALIAYGSWLLAAWNGIGSVVTWISPDWARRKGAGRILYDWLIGVPL